jgi:hypothetical protein
VAGVGNDCSKWLEPMATPGRKIFRESALRRYAEAQDKTVLPKFVRPRAFVALWALVAILFVALIVLAFLTKIRLQNLNRGTLSGREYGSQRGECGTESRPIASMSVRRPVRAANRPAHRQSVSH